MVTKKHHVQSYLQMDIPASSYSTSYTFHFIPDLHPTPAVYGVNLALCRNDWTHVQISTPPKKKLTDHATLNNLDCDNIPMADPHDLKSRTQSVKLQQKN